MTILEAILEELNPFPIRVKLIEKKCIDADIDCSMEYSALQRSTIIPIIIKVLIQYLSLGSVSEGGVSLGFTSEDIRKRIIALKKEIGEDSEGLEPTVEMLFL